MQGSTLNFLSKIERKTVSANPKKEDRKKSGKF